MNYQKIGSLCLGLGIVKDEAYLSPSAFFNLSWHKQDTHLLLGRERGGFQAVKVWLMCGPDLQPSAPQPNAQTIWEKLIKDMH